MHQYPATYYEIRVLVTVRGKQRGMWYGNGCMYSVRETKKSKGHTMSEEDFKHENSSDR
jgi:hypothetical protein